MQTNVIAVFDIGKTNKKFLLFDSGLRLVHQEERKFDEVTDEDGFACDDIEQLELWMHESISRMNAAPDFIIRALNFTTYGASLAYLDEQGRRLTPVYNYLKPMPEGVMKDFYGRWGGPEEFCRITASPALGMLNSGLQILWLKRERKDIWPKVKDILHFPQYVSHCFTGNVSSEFTSIGCHTAMWDFDNHRYHPWMQEEGISLPEPVPNSTVHDVMLSDQVVRTGIGIHDSSASLVPYFMGTGEQFILISTGTWSIFMNPFNTEPLTAEQLRRDTLCYMSVQQQQVKSSRLFLGHIHDVNLDRLNRHFGVGREFYKTVKTNGEKLNRLLNAKGTRIFFREGVPADFTDATVDLSRFLTFDEAYHRLMADLVGLALESLSLVIPADDRTRVVYISGGFARNEIFTRLLAAHLPHKKVYTSEIDNASALGAAMVVYEPAFGTAVQAFDLGMRLVISDQ